MTPREKIFALKKRITAIKGQLPKNWLSIAEAHYPIFEKSKYRDTLRNVRNGRTTDEDYTAIIEAIARKELTLENAPK